MVLIIYTRDRPGTLDFKVYNLSKLYIHKCVLCEINTDRWLLVITFIDVLWKGKSEHHEALLPGLFLFLR